MPSPSVRVVTVDERDSSWESTTPRYRLFVSGKPGEAAMTLDFLDASLKDVTEAGELAGRDGRLWSAALVVDDPLRGRGLVWLTGFDHDARPSTRAEWRARAEMHDRYLSARSLAGEPVVLPDGRRVIRMFPDHGHRWPLWESFTDAYTRDPDDLGLSASLRDALRRWYDEWEAAGLDGHPGEEWIEEGTRLAALLQAELDGVAEVRPEFGGP